MTQFGAYIDNYDAANLATFETNIGNTVDLVGGYGSGGGGWSGMDPGWIFSSQFLGGTGKPVVLSMPMAPDDATVADYAAIAAGQHDSDIQGWADTILAAAPNDGNPIYVRTTWEVGGEWFPWTAIAQSDPATFKAAWAHFAEVFHDTSDRFQMVWDFTADRPNIPNYYPGDAAVDIISQDVYWNEAYQGGEPNAAFNQTANGYTYGLNWMADFAAQHDKPMAISEWAVPSNSEGGITAQESAQWIQNLTNWINAQNTDGDPGVAYALYWDVSVAYAHDAVVGSNDTVVGAALDAMADSIRASGTGTPGGGGGTPPTYDDPVSLSAGTGPDALVLKISEDEYSGSATYTVSVDSVQIGGTFTASADHASARSDTLTLHGDWGAGPHTVSVDFTNDLYDGTPQTDRNLYVDSATYNGLNVTGTPLDILGPGDPHTLSFTDDGSTGGTTGGGANHEPVQITAGTGPDTIVIGLAQDYYLDDAEYTVSVDNVQIGGTFTASSVAGTGDLDTLTLHGNWATGTHTVSIDFTNDYNDTGGDRNLFTTAAVYNGEEVSGSDLSFYSGGAQTFDFDDTVTGGGGSGGDAPATLSVGTGPDALVIEVSEDEYPINSGAEYTIRVDGAQIGGTLTVSADHGLSSAPDTVTVNGDWGPGQHTVEVVFDSDQWGGDAAHDRNIYVEGAEYNGVSVPGGSLTLLNEWSAHSFTFTDVGSGGGGNPPEDPNVWPEPDPDPNTSYTYPLKNDWTGIGNLVTAYHDATSDWWPVEDIVAAGWQPDAEEGGGGGGDPDPNVWPEPDPDPNTNYLYPHKDNWGGIGQLVTLYHDYGGTSQWLPADDIVALGWQPTDAMLA